MSQGRMAAVKIRCMYCEEVKLEHVRILPERRPEEMSEEALLEYLSANWKRSFPKTPRVHKECKQSNSGIFFCGVRTIIAVSWAEE